jgi:NUMOD3 motif
MTSRSKRKGRKSSPLSRAKISVALKGRTYTRKHRARISAARMGWLFSRETRSRISAGLKGRPLSAEHRAALSKPYLIRDAKTASAQRSAAGKIGARVTTSIRWTCTTHGLTSSPGGIGNHQKKHDDCVIVKPQRVTS